MIEIKSIDQETTSKSYDFDTAVNIELRLNDWPDYKFVRLFELIYGQALLSTKRKAEIRTDKIVLTISSEDSPKNIQDNIDLIKRTLEETNKEISAQQKKEREEFERKRKDKESQLDSVKTKLKGVTL